MSETEFDVNFGRLDLKFGKFLISVLVILDTYVNRSIAKCQNQHFRHLKPIHRCPGENFGMFRIVPYSHNLLSAI